KDGIPAGHQPNPIFEPDRTVMSSISRDRTSPGADPLPNPAVYKTKAAPLARLPRRAQPWGGPPGASRATPRGAQIKAAQTSRSPRMTRDLTRPQFSSSQPQRRG